MTFFVGASVFACVGSVIFFVGEEVFACIGWAAFFVGLGVVGFSTDGGCAWGSSPLT